MNSQADKLNLTGVGALPSVSVVIPTYNRAHLIARAVESVLPNLLPGDEVIVVDDGSTDDTAGAVKPYLDRVQYLRTPNGGAGAARNLGIDACRNPLVAFLDSDDEWMADKLALQRGLMAARPDVAYCFSDFCVKKSDQDIQRKYLARWHLDPRPWTDILGPGAAYSSLASLPPGRLDFSVHLGDLYPALMATNYVATFTLVVWRERAKAARFATDLATCEDWQYFGQLARLGTAAYLDTETAVQWGHAGPRLTDTDDYRTASCRIKVLERVWGVDPDYLSEYGGAFHQILAEQHAICAHWLLEHGRMREARSELKQAPRSRRLDRVLARLPGPLVHALFGAAHLARWLLTDDYSA